MPAIVDLETVQKTYGLHPSAVESQIIFEIEMVALRRGLIISRADAVRVRGFAETIMEYALGGGGAGRVEPTGRRYSSRERDRNLMSTRSYARKVAERMVQRAREGHATPEPKLYIGDRPVRFSTDSRLFGVLCPPPLPPIC